jgi:Na+/melibiose symporter-like transporter
LLQDAAMGRAPKGKIVTVIVISLLVIGFFLSIYITVDEKIPGNAVVVATTEDKLYHSIHFDHVCVAGKTAQTMTVSEAEAKGYKPHSYCEELGYFRGNRQFLFHHLLSKLGFPVNSRWDRNGNWLW